MSKGLIERLRADAESTDDIGLCADAAERIEELERERDAFYMDYRMKCDEEAKGSALVIIERDQLRAELAAALAACKVKDEALNTIVVACYPKGIWQQARDALAIQPDDSALKAWLGEPVGEMHKAHARSLDEKPWCKEILLYSAGNPFDLPEYRVAVYSPKELK